MKRWQPVLVLLAILALWWWQGSPPRQDAPPQGASRPHGGAPQAMLPGPAKTERQRAGQPRALPDFLPHEAHQTIGLILRDGPFPHRQDGAVFGNREKRLPPQPRGYYREYTVRTPGERDRGARRIVAGGDPPREFWYTADHYQTFRRFEVAP